MRLLAIACVSAGALLDVAVACTSPEADVATNGGGAAGGGDAGSAGATSAVRVDFVEVALDGAPTNLTDFAFYPDDSNDFLALAKNGELRRYRLQGESAKLVATFAVAGVHDEGDCGAMSLTFEPELAEGSFLYVGTCVSNQGSAVFRLDLDADLGVVEGSEVTVLQVGHELAMRPWHNVGSIGFEPGGVMWALFGDKLQRGAARDPSSRLGKLIRIVPNRAPGLGGYEPAPDNPQLSGAASPDVYALGLRSPFRGTRDSQGFYWIGDVGGDLAEEVNLVVEPGADFGWADFEGPCDACDGTTPPLLAWPQTADAPYVLDDPDSSSTSARVAWAGPEVMAHEPDRYDGALAGSVLFGDYCAGFVRRGKVDAQGALLVDAPLGHLANASSFRQHGDGFVYAVTFGRCEVTKANEGDEPFSRLFRMVLRE